MFSTNIVSKYVKNSSMIIKAISRIIIKKSAWQNVNVIEIYKNTLTSITVAWS